MTRTPPLSSSTYECKSPGSAILSRRCLLITWARQVVMGASVLYPEAPSIQQLHQCSSSLWLDLSQPGLDAGYNCRPAANQPG